MFREGLKAIMEMVKNSTSEKLLYGLEVVSNGEYFIDSSIFPQVVDILKKYGAHSILQFRL